MTLKHTVENHIVYAVITALLSGIGIGWGACEAVRVAYMSDKVNDLETKITELSQQAKESAATTEPYQKQVTELLSNTKRLEAELANARHLDAEISNCQSSLAKWQQALQSWRAANAQLQSQLTLCSSNDAVIGLVRSIEEKKADLEKELADELRWHTESAQGDDFRRRIAEYQARLISLQEKLVCARR